MCHARRDAAGSLLSLVACWERTWIEWGGGERKDRGTGGKGGNGTAGGRGTDARGTKEGLRERQKIAAVFSFPLVPYDFYWLLGGTYPCGSDVVALAQHVLTKSLKWWVNRREIKASLGY